MAEPCVESLIAILKGGLHLVERSTYVSSSSPALERLREAVYEVAAELDKAAKLEQQPDREHAPTPYS